MSYEFQSTYASAVYEAAEILSLYACMRYVRVKKLCASAADLPKIVPWGGGHRWGSDGHRLTDPTDIDLEVNGERGWRKSSVFTENTFIIR